jgi:7,8-dihydroneopterin aldolase/epimerase/oxygenase
MDETATAFELPFVRAAATHVGPPLDRISVRDYVRDVEIGAFQPERGITQRVRFNVVLEVSHHAAAQDDDVDQVISYDTITEAIEHALATERVNLLETLAERISAGCLADRRAVRVFVRIEKLDRIPGALGVEIVRSRLPETAPWLRPPAAAPVPGLSFGLVHLAPDLVAGPQAVAWLDALARWGRPFVLCLGPAAPVAPAATDPQRRIGLLAIDQAAWALADRDPRFSVAATRTELDWALKAGRLPAWAPSHMLAAALPPPASDASDPASLAAWLAAELGAGMLVVAGAAPPAAATPVRRVVRPQDLTTLG